MVQQYLFFFQGIGGGWSHLAVLSARLLLAGFRGLVCSTGNGTLVCRCKTSACLLSYLSSPSIHLYDAVVCLLCVMSDNLR